MFCIFVWHITVLCWSWMVSEWFDSLQTFGSDAFTAGTVWEPTVGTDQLDTCADVEGNGPHFHIFQRFYFNSRSSRD